MKQILVIEDDPHIRRGLVDNLRMEGYEVLEAEDGERGLAIARGSEAIDLIVLDITLPKLNGFEVCQTLKTQPRSAPIIILSSRGEEADKVRGLELGADDYVTKPFSPRELMVRIKAVLRRVVPVADRGDDVCVFGRVRVDFKRYQAWRDDREIRLTAAEFKVLKTLVDHAGAPVSRHVILKEIWSDEVTTRTVDTHIWKLREKLEDDPACPKHIITMHRIGYKFQK